MDIRFSQNNITHNTNVYRTAGRAHRALLDRMDKRAGTSSYTQNEDRTVLKDTLSLSVCEISGRKDDVWDAVSAGGTNTWETASQELIDRINKLNSAVSSTRIGDIITLKDGTTINIHEIPRLDLGALGTVTAKENVMDFGSGFYFKHTNSKGKDVAIFSLPCGVLSRPYSETTGHSTFDLETERYINFWNNLSDGRAMMASPAVSKHYGYTSDQERAYLDEAGIEKGFFSLKIGSRSAEFYYSASKHLSPIHTKEEYDKDYEWMTSPDSPYSRSRFEGFEPGTEIMIGGEPYRLKEDLTLDLPYGIDIFDIELKCPDTGAASAGVDIRV